MSIALMTIAWALDVGPTDKLVLLALADNANDAGVCWPSMATIARKCGLSERAARMGMRRLEAAGHVSSTDRTGTSRLYTVHPGISCPPAGNAPRQIMPVTPASAAPKPSRTTISSKKTSSSSKTRACATPFPIDFVPTMSGATAAVVDGWPPGRLASEIEAMADWHAKEGKLSKDWQASWRTWVRNSTKWEPRNGLSQRAYDNRAGQSVPGFRPDPSLYLRKLAIAELEAEERAAADQTADRGFRLALPTGGVC